MDMPRAPWRTPATNPHCLASFLARFTRVGYAALTWQAGYVRLRVASVAAPGLNALPQAATAEALRLLAWLVLRHARNRAWARFGLGAGKGPTTPRLRHSASPIARSSKIAAPGDRQCSSSAAVAALAAIEAAVEVGGLGHPLAMIWSASGVFRNWIADLAKSSRDSDEHARRILELAAGRIRSRGVVAPGMPRRRPRGRCR